MKNQSVNKTKHKYSKKTMLVIYAYLLLLLLIISVAATYTWFSLTRTPQVSNLSMYVTSRSGLELALTPDSDKWGSQLSYLDMASDSVPLRPITWSEKDKMFYTAVYGIDGRLSGKWQPLSDERNANRDNYEGYYGLGIFYARTSQNVTVSLTHAMQVQEGVSGSGTYLIGTPVWNTEQLSHTNAGQGAENAVRIGIQITDLDDNDRPIKSTERFFIYEPNCDSHVDGSVGYVETPSIDGDSTLVPSERLILQTHSSWTEASPTQNGVQVYTLGEFTTPVELFTLKADQKVMIRLYIWLEGQDVDCTNAIREAQIIANMQFNAVPENQSGLQPVR